MKSRSTVVPGIFTAEGAEMISRGVAGSVGLNQVDLNDLFVDKIIAQTMT